MMLKLLLMLMMMMMMHPHLHYSLQESVSNDPSFAHSSSSHLTPLHLCDSVIEQVSERSQEEKMGQVSEMCGIMVADDNCSLQNLDCSCD